METAALVSEDTEGYLAAAFVHWERLRVAYNLVLLAEGILLSGTLGAFPEVLRLWPFILGFGVIANAFYCLGLLTEAYLHVAFKLQMAAVRRLVFLAGLLFSMTTTLGAGFWLWLAPFLNGID